MHLTRLIATLLLLLCLSWLSALPDAFTASGNPELYNTLREKAQQNLRNLPKSLQKQYRDLLRRNPDILMAYLIAYESDANLACADPADVDSNYRQILILLNRFGTDHSPEFFLSYVAKQTVSDERIEAYRLPLLNDGLRKVMESSKNELELYRAVSQWCVGRLKFQPTSGRDQTPLDITQKSILGRCEEMQILFVAAARTVGLPARPASSPWWAHTDNNHAWAEVWLDGAWHYTGDMDAAYYPDQTWFSGLIDKTVLILADGSLPSEQDEVLIHGKYDCVINSIRNYAGERTRTLRLQTLDPEGNPLPETQVGVMVYNWGSLRPLVFVQTDAEGKLTLSVGRGDFYLSAFKDGNKALQLVPSTEDTELYLALVLKDEPLADQNAWLEYPANPYEWKQAPPVWNAGVEREKANWNAQDQNFNERQAASADTLIGALAAASRGNYTQLLRFLRRHPTPEPGFCEFLLNDDPKYLWQADSDQLEALYDFYRRHQDTDLSTDDLAAVLRPAVHYEELPQTFKKRRGVPQLYPKAFYKKGKTNLERLNNAMAWLKKNYRIEPSQALQGLLPLDVAVQRKHLTPYQYRILAVSLARANGIPAHFTRQPNLIYVMLEPGQWGYYDLVKCAPEADVKDDRAFITLQVLASDEIGAPLSGIRSSLQLTRYQDGAFYWMDNSFEDQGSGSYQIRVPRGEYYLNLGYRISDSKTAFQLKHLDFSELDSLRLELTLAEYPRNWGRVSEEIAALLEQVDTSGYDIVLIGNHDQENSIRLAEKLRGLGKSFLWLGYEPAAASLDNYRFSATWREMVDKDQRNRVRTITLVRKDGSWQSFEGMWESFVISD